jgi:mRNA-degrading endonuclease HigB of HigAB toxin-antitoxin module
MKLNDILKSYNWLSIEMALIRLYPDQEAMVDDYRNVVDKLKFLVPEENDMSIVLTEYDCDPDDESEVRTYVDVSGRKKEKDPKSITDGYAIEFVAWDKWLGMDIAPETTRKFSDLEIIAHCLFEMTFIGFSEEEIHEQFEMINDRVEEYKNLTEEEKEEKTISLDELKKRLNKKGS